MYSSKGMHLIGHHVKIYVSQKFLEKKNWMLFISYRALNSYSIGFCTSTQYFRSILKSEAVRIHFNRQSIPFHIIYRYVQTYALIYALPHSYESVSHCSIEMVERGTARDDIANHTHT